MASPVSSIAIATTSFAGPSRSGGVGVAFQRLAETLAKAGHKVTVIFLPEPSVLPEIPYWREVQARKGIELVVLPPSEIPLDGSPGSVSSVILCEFLKTRSFDVVHFADVKGLAYFPMLAKKTGLAFENTPLCLHLFAPTLWQCEVERVYPAGPIELELAFLERRSAEMADVVFAPHRRILDWARASGWKLPKRTYIEPYPRRERGHLGKPREKVNEIVFLGRLGTWEDLNVFCKAIELLPRRLMRNRQVTFLGNYGLWQTSSARDQLLKSLSDWKIKTTTFLCMNDEEALDYLRGGRALAVLSNNVESFGRTPLECIENGIPFILNDAGEPAEGLAKRLAKKLAEIPEKGSPRESRPASDPALIERRWVRWHQNVRIPARASSDSLKNPLVSVCIAYYEQPQYLRQCLESMERQTYRNFEVILVDDASSSKESRSLIHSLKGEFASRRWKLVLNAKRSGPARSRNRAAQVARGEYLLFADSDDLQKPHSIERALRAARRTSSDIVTCWFDRFTGEEAPRPGAVPSSRWIAVGDDLLKGAFVNVFGGSNALIRRKVFLELGGFGESLYGEDWELFARAVLRGYRLITLPDALFWARAHENRLSRASASPFNPEFHLAPYAGLSRHPEFKAYLSLIHRAFKNFRGHRPIFEEEEALKLRTYPLARFSRRIHARRGRTGSGIVLSGFRIPRRRILIAGTVHGKRASALKLSYFLRGQAGEQTRVCGLAKGRSSFRFLLNGSEARGPFRIAAVSDPGAYVIKTLEVLAEA